MKRGTFIKTCGSMCLSTSAMAVLLQNCSSVHYATHSLDGNTIILSRAEFIEMKKGQQIQRSFIIIRDASLPFPICVYNNEAEATALLMQCTHQGCEVNPNAYSLVCPCHGSEFDTNGKVINPPAEEALTSYKVTMDGDNFYIHLNQMK